MDWSAMLAPLVYVLVALVAAAVIGLIGWVATVAAGRMKAGTGRDTLLELAEGAKMVVAEIAQTMRPALYRKALRGELSWKAVGETLKEEAVRRLEDQLSKHALKQLANNTGDLRTTLSRAVESAVVDLKKGAPPRIVDLGGGDKVPSFLPPMEPPDAA